MTNWAILIATTEDRRPLFEELKRELERQILQADLENAVKIFYDEDNKQKSIGKKRNDLLQESEGFEYINYFDSDDYPSERYILDIYESLRFKPDCVGFKILMTTNGRNEETCIHSLKNPRWEKKDGVYLRNVTHFNPVKRELAVQVGFKDERFGEDKIYSDEISQLCKKEIFIDKYIFHYRYSTQVPNYQKFKWW